MPLRETRFFAALRMTALADSPRIFATPARHWDISTCRRFTPWNSYCFENLLDPKLAPTSCLIRSKQALLAIAGEAATSPATPSSGRGIVDWPEDAAGDTRWLTTA